MYIVLDRKPSLLALCRFVWDLTTIPIAGSAMSRGAADCKGFFGEVREFGHAQVGNSHEIFHSSETSGGGFGLL